MSEKCYRPTWCDTDGVRAFTDADWARMADPQFARRYRAAAGHEARRDGSFVTGMPMSESFCRPGCASRTPRPSRVNFYRTAAAALAVGLRPCPRCRPEMTPPTWGFLTGDGLGRRALRLIGDGAIDRGGVPAVAAALGITPRHLLRAVQSEADCGPLDYARAMRLRAGRLLLTATGIPMRDVAEAAGFATVRQFNSTVRTLSGTTPGSIRFGRRAVIPGERDPGPLVVRYALPTTRAVPAAQFARWAEHAIPEVESGTAHWYARTVRLPRGFGEMRIDLDSGGRVLIRLSAAELRDFVPLAHRAEALVGLAAGDGGVAAAAGDLAEQLLRAEIARGLSPERARTALGALAAALGDASRWGTVFPTAEAIATDGRSVLRGPAERIEAILRLARAIHSGEIAVAAGWSRAALVAQHPALLGP